MSPNQQSDQGPHEPIMADPATRRCWRCLQHFACSADDVLPGPAEWWLCDPCQAALLPRTTARH